MSLAAVEQQQHSIQPQTFTCIYNLNYIFSPNTKPQLFIKVPSGQKVGNPRQQVAALHGKPFYNFRPNNVKLLLPYNYKISPKAESQ